MTSTIGKRIHDIKASLPEGVTLVAVSKFHPVEALREAYDSGQRVFGESRANELVAKAQALPADIHWHFIGHLQTNKVRTILPHVTLIHSIDSERLLKLVDAEAQRINRTVDVLLQVHVAKEETKFGFSPEELNELAAGDTLQSLRNTRIRGVMGMASNVDDEVRIKDDFRRIAIAFDDLKRLSSLSSLDTVSMGMSHDYGLAIDAGSNMVRIGTTIFGEREY